MPGPYHTNKEDGWRWHRFWASGITHRRIQFVLSCSRPLSRSSTVTTKRKCFLLYHTPGMAPQLQAKACHESPPVPEPVKTASPTPRTIVVLMTCWSTSEKGNDNHWKLLALEPRLWIRSFSQGEYQRDPPIIPDEENILGCALALCI